MIYVVEWSNMDTIAKFGDLNAMEITQKLNKWAVNNKQNS